MAINCETKKRIIAYFTSIICGPFANDYSLLAYGDCRVWWAKVNEECKDLSGQHLLSVMALVLCVKCLVLLLSLYSVCCICFSWRMSSLKFMWVHSIGLRYFYSSVCILFAERKSHVAKDWNQCFLLCMFAVFFWFCCLFLILFKRF